MKKIIATFIEDAPEGLFIANPHRDGKRLDSGGNAPLVADILKVCKKANLFDEEGNMTVEYYTEDEWNGTAESHETERDVDFEWKPTNIDGFTFLHFANYCLDACTIEEFANDLIKGMFPFSYADLAPHSKSLIDYILNWDNRKPFCFYGDTHVSQHTWEDEGVTRYSVDFFII